MRAKLFSIVATLALANCGSEIPHGPRILPKAGQATLEYLQSNTDAEVRCYGLGDKPIEFTHAAVLITGSIAGTDKETYVWFTIGALREAVSIGKCQVVRNGRVIAAQGITGPS